MPIPSYILPSAPAYTEDSVYALIPTPSTPIYTPDAISFTRGSDATRTDSNGLIQRSPWNLVEQSENYNVSPWSRSFVAVTPNDIVAPNGTNTGNKIVLNNSGSQRYQIQQIITTNTTLPMTYTFYAKKNQIDIFVGVIGGLGGMSYEVEFDLTNITATDVYIAAAINTAKSIQSVGNGWFKCTITAGSSSGVINNVKIFKDTTGNGTDSFYIWGAQLNIGSTAKPYFPTTDRLNVPRIDFSQGSCPALLLEPQRTNLCLSSNSIGGTSWSAVYGGVGLVPTITLNYATAPDGTTSASRLQLSLGGGTTTTDQSLVTQTLTATSTRGSFYIKTTDGSTKTIYLRGSSATNVVVTGTWTRYDFDAGTLTGTQFGLGLRGGQTPINSNTVDILVWGAQLEVGAYATTYIPTTTTSVTRLADSFSKSNIFTNGLITAAGGTWFLELRGNIAYTRDGLSTGLFLDTDASSYANGINIRNVGGGSTRLSISKWVSGSGLALYTTTTDTTKIAIKWNGSTADVFANGTKVVSATSFTPTAMQFLKSEGNQIPIFIQAMALFSTPLSDAALITMTT
jgi:hypothetical protein